MRSDRKPDVKGIILSTGHRLSWLMALALSKAVISQMPSANLVPGTEVGPTCCLIEDLTMGTSVDLRLSSE